ncbi:D-2-hydroxyacid dehydrogenase [Colletotrichum sp. SAR 10_70]|nr:D-2-hydroxyacid dehydrogenase [Colletotrichum sp. SAR 10_71]KAI8191063.1 D-2-hydroxyacid dehydrogenase [Colletotrichum sp. SAR 10_75]KAI8193070.1 D-2-hydroxyacid dehydrogenase [Colletotrichum sp. SAR 10_70]KAI8193368.1 D-2-hydroxyacid dehydrogenase [Colletotrichum sp. SAR 10_65]KAI8236918.1 D-2-hydroxyacid dehydrogenase [Colletotrichum sp. SAR 10_86]
MGDLAPQKSPLANDILLVFLSSPRNEEWIGRVESNYPGLQVRWANNHLPDGRFLLPDELPDEVWDGVTMIISFNPPSLERLKSVRFVQLTSAGADKWRDHPVYKNPDIPFCTTNGCHPPQIAEWVIGSWLASQHHFLRYAENQKQGFWEGPMAVDFEDSVGLRMGILGYGAIGRQCGKIAQAMGMEVYAFTRSEKATPESRKDDSYVVPGTGDPDGLVPSKWFHGASKEAVNNFLAQDLDLLVIGMPLTSETTGLIGKEQFEILSKKKTFVSNIARGHLIQTDALIEALETGKIRAAALDVTDPEPLPKDHPLWKAPNVFITPHGGVAELVKYIWIRPLFQKKLCNFLTARFCSLEKRSSTVFVSDIYLSSMF